MLIYTLSATNNDTSRFFSKKIRTRNILHILLTFCHKNCILTLKQAIYCIFCHNRNIEHVEPRKTNRQQAQAAEYLAGGPCGYVGGQPAHPERHRERRRKPEHRRAFQGSRTPRARHHLAGAGNP